MAVFPALTPSSRTFTPGEYPHTPYQAISGVEGRVRHSNTMLSATLRVTFICLTEADMLSILSHYNGQQGGFIAFAIPSQLLNGVSAAADYTLTGHQWRYVQPPIIDDIPCAGHSVELTLESVPPESIVLSGLAGLTSTVSITLVPGAAAAANGLNKTVAITLATTGVVIPGFDELITSVTISLEAGASSVAGDAIGLTESVTLILDGGSAIGGGGAVDYWGDMSIQLYGWDSLAYIEWGGN